MAINKDKLRESAQKYLQKGQIDKAIKEFQRLVEDDPKDVRTLLKIGDLHTRAGDNAAAVETYNKVAQFYTDQGFFLKAVAVYKQVLKVDPSNVDVNTKLAELYSQLGLVSDAQAQLKILIGLHERDGKPELALRAVKMMVDLDPDGIPGRLKLAELYSQAGKTADARAELGRAAEVLKASHRIDDYVKVAERMSQLDPSDAKLARELATIYLQKGEAKHALAKLQVPFKDNPRDLDTLELLATAFRDVGQPTRSVAVYKEIARIAASTDDTGAQAKAMRKVLTLAPDDAEALAFVGGDGATTASTATAKAAPAKPAATTPKPQQVTRDSPSGGNALGRIVPKQREIHAGELVEIDRRPKVEAVRARPEPEPSDDLDLDVEVNLDDDEGPVTGSLAAIRAEADEPVGDHRRVDRDADEELEVAIGEPDEDIVLEAEVDEEVELDGAEIEAEDDEERTATRPSAAAVPAGATSAGPRSAIAPGPSAKEIEDAVSRILVEAEVYIKYGLKPKALDHLRRVFTIDPNHRVAKERYKNLLLQTGHQGEAADALFEMAQAAHAAGDSSLAKRDLDELLALVPSHARARKLLDKLAPPAEDDGPDELTAPAMPGMRDVPQAQTRSAVAEVSISYEPSTAAQSIDLDEGIETELDEGIETELDEGIEPGVEHEVEPGDAIEASVRAAPPVVISGTASVPSLAHAPAPQPSKPKVTLPDVDDELDALLSSAVPKRRATGEPATSAPSAATKPPDATPPTAAAEARVQTPPPVSVPAPAPAPSTPAPAPTELPSASIDLSGELEEARFYQEQGLLDEARDALAVLLAQYPDHPDLLEFQRSLAPEATAGLDHTTTTTVLAAGDAPLAPAATSAVSYDDEPEATIETGGFDLGADLAAELESVAASDDFQVSFGDVFDDFKKGVAKQVEESDHDTHYNLGIAYKEMGLFDDAIREFQLATRDPTKQLGALTMMGLCALAAGNTNEALQYFQRGLGLPGLKPEEGMALRFEIAQAYEQMEKWADAAKFYENVQQLDPTFRDVGERVTLTRSRAAANPAVDVTSELDELLADTDIDASAAPKRGGKISYL